MDGYATASHAFVVDEGVDQRFDLAKREAGALQEQADGVMA